MVKAPENFLDEYLRHEKGLGSKTGIKSSRVSVHKVSNEELARLKQNMQTLWGIYGTPEIKEILSMKHKIRFLNIETDKVSIKLSYIDKGISMEYELNTGFKKELAGAQIYKQAEINLSRYFTSETGAGELLKTTDDALAAIVDILIGRVIQEADIWNAILKGEQIHLSTVSSF